MGPVVHVFSRASTAYPIMVLPSLLVFLGDGRVIGLSLRPSTSTALAFSMPTVLSLKSFPIHPSLL